MSSRSSPGRDVPRFRVRNNGPTRASACRRLSERARRTRLVWRPRLGYLRWRLAPSRAVGPEADLEETIGALAAALSFRRTPPPWDAVYGPIKTLIADSRLAEAQRVRLLRLFGHLIDLREHAARADDAALSRLRLRRTGAVVAFLLIEAGAAPEGFAPRRFAHGLNREIAAGRLVADHRIAWIARLFETDNGG